MNIFLDANIYLSFYRFSDDDIGELQKVLRLIRTKEIQLYIPVQVRDEFYRNREKVIANALAKVKEASASSGFPQLVQQYDEYDELRKVIGNYERLKNELLKKVEAEASSKELLADKLLSEIFDIAQILNLKSDTVQRAKDRHARGNPPGKRGSLGDAINWELLLQSTPQNEDLVLVAQDKDYVSPLDNSVVNDFLQNEWQRRKGAAIQYYSNLKPLFDAHYQDIKISTYIIDIPHEAVKTTLCLDLAYSKSFAETHSLIEQLSMFNTFSDKQLKSIVEALKDNNQVYRILEDPDVKDFYRRIFDDFLFRLDSDTYDFLEDSLKSVEDVRF